MSNFSFRKFIETDLNLWLEMALGYKSRGMQMPMPQAVADLLRVVPSEGGKANYKNALEWIFSKGLYNAAKQRHELAKMASDLQTTDAQGRQVTLKQKLGRPVYDHEVYSPKAWAQIPELKTFYQQTYGSNPSKYEPKQFLLPGNGDAVLRISMDQVNAMLKKLGRQPFQFGGPNGLIEYMEDGDWAEPRSAKGPLSHQGPHHNRHGFDLSKPQLSYHPDSGSYMYHFSDFDPPQNTSSGQQTQIKALVNNLLRNSSDLYKSYVAGQSGDVHPEVAPELERLKGSKLVPGELHGDKNTFADEYGYDNRFNKTRDFGPEGEDDAETYALLNVLVRMGLDQGIEERGINPEAKQKILDKVLPQNTMNIIANYHPGTDVKSNRRLNTLINLGVDRLRKIGMNAALQQYAEPLLTSGSLGDSVDLESLKQGLQNAASHQASTRMKIEGEPLDLRSVGQRVPLKATYEPIDNAAIQKLMDKGYRWLLTKGERQQGLKEPAPERNFATLELGDHELRLRRGPNGQWLITNPEDEHPGEPLADKYAKSISPLMLGRTASMKFNPNMPEMTPVDPKLQSAIQADMIKNPRKYGYGLGEEENFGNQMSSIDDLDSALKKAANSAGYYSRQGKNKLDWDDIQNNALLGMLRHAADYRFRFGNVNTHNDRLRQYLAMPNIGNITDPTQQEGWIKRVRSIMQAGKEPQAENKADTETYVPQNVLNAFLVNGKWWRHQKAASFAQQQIKKAEAGKEKVIQATDHEGDTQTLAHNIAAGGAKGGTGRLTSDLRSDDVFDNSGKGRKKPTRDPLTAEYDPGVLTSLDPDERSADVKQVIGGVQQKTGLQDAFKNNSVGQDPRRGTPDSLYSRRYAQFSKNAQSMLGGPHAADGLGRILDANAESTNPEEARAAIDAVADAAISQITKMADEPHLSPQESTGIAKMFINLFQPYGKYYLGKYAQTHKIDISSGVKSLAEFMKSKPELAQRIKAAFTPEPAAPQAPAPVQKPIVPPALPGTPTSTVGADFGKQTKGGFVMDEPSGGLFRPLKLPSGERFSTPTDYRKALLQAKGTPKEKELIAHGKNSQIPAYVRVANELGLNHMSAEHFVGYKQWRMNKLQETDAVYDGSKPTTFNWWGAVGLPGGKVIDGDVPVKKTKNRRKK